MTELLYQLPMVLYMSVAAGFQPSGASSAAETGEEAGGVPWSNGAWSGA